MTHAPWVSTAAVRVVAVDAGSRTIAEVEQLAGLVDEVLAGRVDESSYVLSAHHITEPDRHFAVVLSWTDGPAREEIAQALADMNDSARVLRDDHTAAVGDSPDALPGLAAAIADHTGRAAGRLTRFPGRTAIERRLTAGEIVTLSCVDEVVGLAGLEIQPDSVVNLTGFARPQWSTGRCVLLVQPGTPDLVPFEVRQQIPCCADH